MFLLYMKIILIISACLLGLGACFQEIDHYETLVLFVIYFVLKLFKNIDYYIKRDAHEAYAYFFLEQGCNLVTVLV